MLLLTGQIVICDADAPIEYGCRVLVRVTTTHEEAFIGRCGTRHPSKAKDGITVVHDQIGPRAKCGSPKDPTTNVYRVVLEVPSLFEHLRLGPSVTVKFDRASASQGGVHG